MSFQKGFCNNKTQGRMRWNLNLKLKMSIQKISYLSWIFECTKLKNKFKRPHRMCSSGEFLQYDHLICQNKKLHLSIIQNWKGCCCVNNMKYDKAFTVWYKPNWVQIYLVANMGPSLDFENLPIIEHHNCSCISTKEKQ